MNTEVFSIPCRHGLLTDTGYDICNACIDILPAPKAIHLSVRSEQASEVELAINPHEAGELIFKLHRAIQQHHRVKAHVDEQLRKLRASE